MTRVPMTRVQTAPRYPAKSQNNAGAVLGIAVPASAYGLGFKKKLNKSMA